jgi:hypothetical protein
VKISQISQGKIRRTSDTDGGVGKSLKEAPYSVFSENKARYKKISMFYPLKRTGIFNLGSAYEEDSCGSQFAKLEIPRAKLDSHSEAVSQISAKSIIDFRL